MHDGVGAPTPATHRRTPVALDPDLQISVQGLLPVGDAGNSANARLTPAADDAGPSETRTGSHRPRNANGRAAWYARDSCPSSSPRVCRDGLRTLAVEKITLGAGGGPFLQRDGVAEAFELADEAFAGSFGVAAGEEVAARVGVGLAGA